MLRMCGCCVICERALGMLESNKSLRSLLEDLSFGKNTCVYAQLVPPMPYRPHYHSHEIHILPFLMSQVECSLMFEASSCLRSSKLGMFCHISSNVVHSHRAWVVVSDSTPHSSYLSSVRIFLLNRLRLAGMDSLQAHHMKFCTLLGMLSPQISFQTSFCYCVLPTGDKEVSLARNLELEFTV